VGTLHESPTPYIPSSRRATLLWPGVFIAYRMVIAYDPEENLEELNQMSVENIDEIVLDILDGMSLRDKAAIAQLDEGDVPYLQYAFAKIADEDDELGRNVMHLIWKVLQETHRVRVVK